MARRDGAISRPGGAMARLFRNSYGAGPLHLMAMVASLAAASYGFFRIMEHPRPESVVLWLGGAIVAHDLIAFPLYSLLNLISAGAARAARRSSVPIGLSALNHLRVPAVLSALMLLVWFPLILGLSESRFERASGLGTDVYLERWLLLTAVLFAGSALVYAVRRGLGAAVRGRPAAVESRR